MRRFWIFAAIALSWGVAFPQIQVPPLFATPYVALYPDSAFYFAIVVDILEGWAIAAAHVTLKGLLPTKISVEPVPGLVFGEVLYPEPKKKWLEFAKTYLEVYTGQVIFVLPVYVEKDASPGLRTIHMRLEYQACEAKLCLLPDVVELTAFVFILPRPGASASLPASPRAQRAGHPAHPQWILR